MTCPCCTAPAVLFVDGTVRPEDFFATASYSIAHGRGRDVLPVYRCMTCGHGFTNVDGLEDMIAHWYANAPTDDLYVREEIGRRITARRVLDRIQDMTALPGTLLDIGTGPGFFVDEALCAGWQAEGLETAEWAINYQQAHLPALKIHRRGVDSLQDLPTASYDVVTAFDILEHLPHPSVFIENCQRLLKPGGLLVLTTPRFDSIPAQLLKKHWHAIMPAHLHYFSRRSLQNALLQAGFHITKMKHHTRTFSLGYLYAFATRFVSQRLLGKDRTTSASSHARGMHVPLNLRDEWEVYARNGR